MDMEKDLQPVIDQANQALRLAESGQIEAGIDQLQAIISKHPNMIGARHNLGGLLNRVGRSEEACAVLREALQRQPDFAEAWNNYGLALFHLTRTGAAEQAFARAVEIKPDYHEAHSNRCLMPLYRSGTDAVAAQALEDWRRSCAAAISDCELKSADAAPRGSLKIGLVSPDFRVHSVAYFLFPILQHWSKQAGVELFLYSDVPQPDHMTEKFQALPLHYTAVQQLSHPELAAKIRADGINVLFELCGHFSYNRLPVFAARAAPCQIAWLGYPAPTGTPNIDFRISDAVVAPPQAPPPGDDQAELLRLESGYHCYAPPPEAPPIAAAPVSTGAPFTFGCFNNAFKISPEIARVWGTLLQQNPATRLLLKAKSFANPSVRQQILTWIHPEPGVQERVSFRARDASLREHLAAYNEVDLALDTYPYNGTTTTCEALWMGVPCLTLTGQVPQSRVGASLLQQAQLKHFVTTSSEQYIQLATLFATAPERLKSYRSALRSHLSQTALIDPAPIADELLARLVRTH